MPSYYGQGDPPVDAVIETYFPGQREGACIEVGACDGVFLSNTLYFEKLGWRCLCIEPNPAYAPALQRNRRGPTLSLAVANTCDENMRFTVCELPGRNYSAISGLSIDSRLLHAHESYKPILHEITVPVRPLSWCIDQHFRESVIHFISIDTEGSELSVLESFDVNGYGTRLLIVENNFNDDSTRSYLAALGWHLDRRVEVNDFFIR